MSTDHGIIDIEYFKEILGGYKPQYFKVSLIETKEILSCNYCNGIGKIAKEELSDYHRREYSTDYETCKYCDGDGRIIEVKILADFGDIKYKSSTHQNETKNILIEKYNKPYIEGEIVNIRENKERKTFYFPFESMVTNER